MEATARATACGAEAAVEDRIGSEGGLGQEVSSAFFVVHLFRNERTVDGTTKQSEDKRFKGRASGKTKPDIKIELYSTRKTSSEVN